MLKGLVTTAGSPLDVMTMDAGYWSEDITKACAESRQRRLHRHRPLAIASATPCASAARRSGGWICRAANTEATPLITRLSHGVKIPELDPASMSEREWRQLASEQQHWQRRLETTEAGLSSQPKRIEASYKMVSPRLEPAGLVYLWPISG